MIFQTCHFVEGIGKGGKQPIRRRLKKRRKEINASNKTNVQSTKTSKHGLLLTLVLFSDNRTFTRSWSRNFKTNMVVRPGEVEDIRYLRGGTVSNVLFDAPNQFVVIRAGHTDRARVE